MADLDTASDDPATASSAPHNDAFISYSRKDGAFATRLQQALQKFTPPKGLGREARRLRVFRDTQDFTGAEYFSAVQAHLAGSRKLIVICSPAAVASQYVNDEVDRFVQPHGASNLVPVLWQGVPNAVTTTQPGTPCWPTCST